MAKQQHANSLSVLLNGKLSFKKDFLYFYVLTTFCLCTHKCTAYMHAFSAHGSQEKALFEMEIRVVVSGHVGARK